MGYPTQQQKVDYLFKKIGFSASKTGVAEDQTSGFSGDTKKAPPNEAIPSPLVVPASSLWADSSYIPATPPTSSNGYVGVYSTATAYRMTVDTSVSNNRAFVARSTWSNHSSAIDGDWIDTQFGADYLIKVYKGNPASGTPGVAYTNITAAGTGGGPDDTWFFDYSSGVLNFNGADLDGQLVGIHTDNVYIVGYRYLGTKGVQPAAGIGTFHNLYVSGISTFAGNAYANSDLLIAENIVHTGDTNTKITFPSAGDQITFRTAGNQRVAIAADGKVGVGYNFIPSTYMFEVRAPDATAYSATGTNAAIALGNNNSSAATNSTGIHMFTDGNGRGFVNLNALNNSTSASADFTIQTRHNGTGGERLRITSDGKVGIAQASPDYALDVTGDIGFTSQMRGASGSASAPAYSFDGDSDSGMYRGGTNILSFATAGVERIRLDSTGHSTIYSGAHDKGLDILPTANSRETRLRIQGKASDGTEHTFTFAGKASTNALYMSGTGPMCFIGTQNVGVQNAAPTSPLHVGSDTNPHTTKATLFVGPSSGDGSFHLRGGSPTVFFDNSSSGNAKILTDGADLIISDGTLDSNGTERLRIRASGDIHIVNNVNVAGVSTFNGNVNIPDSTSNSPALRLGSDADFKIHHDGSDAYLANATGQIAFKTPDNSVAISITDSNTIFNDTTKFNSSILVSEDIAHIGDTNTKISFPSSGDQLVIQTGGTERFRIRSDGNINIANALNVVGVSTVGEGIFVPDSKDIKFGGSYASPNLRIYNNGTHTYIKEQGSGNLYVSTNSLNVLNQNTGQTLLKANQGSNGYVQLYQNNVVRLVTTGTGVNITDDLNVAGIATFTGAIDANGNLDVDGYTELDDLNVSGVSTFVGETNIGTGGTVFTALVGATPAVGIGSATPDYMLDVAGAINSETDIKVQGVSVSETALNDAVAMAIALG